LYGYRQGLENEKALKEIRDTEEIYNLIEKEIGEL
jgi:hypothetical protein